MQLTIENVRKIFYDSLHHEGEEVSDPVICEGIVNSVGFHRARLESHKDEIASMLVQLPKEFHKSHGGGHSFLNMCMLDSGEQWADEHIDVEKLLLLGLGIEKAAYNLGPQFWPLLPGGVAYVYIDF
jgi:hypothetical protein